jgi:thimet oligopeptidase
VKETLAGQYCAKATTQGFLATLANIQRTVTLFSSLSVFLGGALRGQEVELRLDRLTPADVRGLVDHSIAEATSFLAQILAVRGTRTVENTLRPYDDLLIHFNAVQIVGLLAVVHPDSDVRAAAAEGIRRRGAFQTALRLNPQLYHALAAIDTAAADAETRYYLARLLAEFRRDGVDRNDAVRTTIAALRDEQRRLEQRFNENLRLDTASLAFGDSAELAGLPPDWLQSQPRGPAGEIRVGVGDLRFVLQNARNPESRERTAIRLQNRGAPANHFVVDSLLRARERMATLLGYPTWAAYQFDGMMAGSPRAVERFLDEIQRRSEPAVSRELEQAPAVLGQPGPLRMSDLQYLAFHAETGGGGARSGALVREYFPYERVRDAILHLADTLFGLQFRPAPDLPVWHPSVEAYRVFDAGRLAGIAYLDTHRRPGKLPASSTAAIRWGVSGRVLPRAAINMSLVRDRPGDPGLLGSEEVAGLFHEFGHLLEDLLAVRPWFGTSGLPAEFDFREVPSIVFERWGRDLAVLRSFARHYRTGEPLPDSLVASLRQPDEMRSGLGLRGSLLRARLSLALHERPPGGDIDSIARTLRDATMPGEPPRVATHPEASFTHLVGYEAAYYTYIWSAVIADDLLSRFTAGLLDPVTARAYRRGILEPGKSAPAGQYIERFLGRPFSLSAWAQTLDAP